METIRKGALMTTGKSIAVRSAEKRYGSLAALNGLSLEIQPGQFTVLLGPSGSGKSTLIRSLAGIEKLDSGKILIGETVVNDGPLNVAPEKRDLGMVFQDYALWPHLTASENIQYALKRRKLSSENVAVKVSRALERVGLPSKGGNYPHQLSGGEQQRVALARAIVADPSVLLFDEPLSNLDADLRERLRIEISTLTREVGATALYITHDQSEAFALADQIGVINHGSIQQIGKPEEIYQSPSSRFVATFTGVSGVFKGMVTCVDETHVEVRIGLATLKVRKTVPISIGEDVEVLIRPTAPSFRGGIGVAISGSVLDVAYRGRGYEHAISTEHGVLTGIFDNVSRSRNERVEITVDPDRCFAFPLEASNLE